MHLTEVQLNDLANDALAEPDRIAAESHIAVCADCRAELAALQQVLADLHTLPVGVAPARDLLAGIHAAIDAEPRAELPARWRMRTVWSGSLGIGNGCHTLDRGYGSDHPRPAMSDRTTVPSPMAGSNPNVQLVSAEQTVLEQKYRTAINELQNLINAQRASLPPSTLRLLEDNLQLINAAIRDSRAALQQNPQNELINESLWSAYEKKLDLLRRATDITAISMRTLTINRIALGLALLCAAPASAQLKVDHKVKVVTNGFIRVEIHSGNVRVQGWVRDTVWIRGTVFEPPGEKLVIAPGPRGAKIALWSADETKVKPSELTILVPLKSRVWIKTQSANAVVTGVEGGVDITTVSGEVTAQGNPRELYVESIGRQAESQCETRSLRAKTGTGDIVARGTTDELLLATVGGRIWALDTRSTQARIESIDGNIYFSGDLAWPGRLELINHSGDVEIGIGPQASAQFLVTTIDGTVRDEYGLKSKESVTKMGRHYSFQLTASPVVEAEVRNFKGSTIFRKTGVKKVAG